MNLRRMKYFIATLIDCIFFYLISFSLWMIISFIVFSTLGNNKIFQILAGSFYLVAIFATAYFQFFLFYKKYLGTPGMRVFGLKNKIFSWKSSFAYFAIILAGPTIIIPFLAYFPFSKLPSPTDDIGGIG